MRVRVEREVFAMNNKALSACDWGKGEGQLGGKRKPHTGMLAFA